MRPSFAVLMALLLSILPLPSQEKPDVAGNVDRWSVPVELGADGWLTYQNARFGFVLPVPPGMKALRPPDNGGGQAFETLDGKVKLVSWASFNVDGQGDLQRRWEEELGEGKRMITYKRKTAAWYVVSGVLEDGTGFYTRYTADKAYACGWSMSYPQKEEKKCATWVERIAKDHEARLGEGEDTVGVPGDR
jgi:hypothetical protein